MFLGPFKDLVAFGLLAFFICGSIRNVIISVNVAVYFRRRIDFQEIRKRLQPGGKAWPISFEIDTLRRGPMVHDLSRVVSFVERAKDSMSAA